MATVDITDANFRETYTKNDIVILDFWAGWCGPCRSFAPIFETASEKYNDIVFGKVDTEAEQKLAAHFGVRSIPTVLVMREGINVYQEAGALGAADIDKLVSNVKSLNMTDVKKAVDDEDAKSS